MSSHHQKSLETGWIPDYSKTPWKMGIMAGHNPANWRATGKGWRKSALEALETIVAMTPHMSVTAMYSDYVLPVADHYEREDFIMEGRTPYVNAINKAVAPLGGRQCRELHTKAEGMGHRQDPPVTRPRGQCTRRAGAAVVRTGYRMRSPDIRARRRSDGPEHRGVRA